MHEWTCEEIGDVCGEIYISFTVLHIYSIRLQDGPKVLHRAHFLLENTWRAQILK